MSIPLSSMRRDISALIVDWGVSSIIKRKTTSRNSAGQISGSFASVGTQILWVQPYEGQSYRMGGQNRIDAGILDDMTHQAYEHFSGTAVQAEDQITVSGESYVYDVIAVQILQTHRHLFLRQVKRS